MGAPAARHGRRPLLLTTRPSRSPVVVRWVTPRWRGGCPLLPALMSAPTTVGGLCRRPDFATVAAPARGCLALPVSDALARRRRRPPHPRATVMTTITIAAAKRGSCVCERGRRLAVGRVGVCGRVCGAKAVPRAAAIPPFPPARTFLLCLFAPRTIASDHRLRLATTKLLAVFGSTLIISLPPSTR